ncbi:hypothetical protein PRIPAC_79680 [Pristionchus pacificus]|uniref:G protein-coupled receptor n=1 Tax=Pristionchus pacificus TaxID=54126 RepID=A0A2A6C204_PRIPA|nr:hypothetical protein PRIPAC_79680 [Pristionchus pacificus]|eukprot:PDM72272.1 G protein-coupled receptor [Pristionchus pacificus]
MTAVPRWIHQVLLNSFALLSFSGNILLIVMVAHPSSKNLGKYRVLLCSFALVDMTISLFHASVIPVFVQAEFGFVIFAFQTLYLNEKLGYALNEIYCILFYEPFVLLTFHFFYRLMSVTRTDDLQAHFLKGMTVAIVMNGVIAMMIVADVWLIYPEIEENFFAEVLMRDYHVDLNKIPKPNIIPVHYIVRLQHAHEYGSGLNWHSILSMLNCGTVINLLIIFNITCGKLIAMSVAFRQMQVQLFRALVVQFTIPVLFCVLPFALIVGLPATGISFGQAGNVMGFIVSAFPVIDPICMILAYSKFRAIITQFFRQLATREKTTIVQSMHASSFAMSR